MGASDFYISVGFRFPSLLFSDGPKFVFEHSKYIDLLAVFPDLSQSYFCLKPLLF